MEAVKVIIGVLEKCRGNGGAIKRGMYEDVPIEVLRRVRKYLITY